MVLLGSISVLSMLQGEYIIREIILYILPLYAVHCEHDSHDKPVPEPHWGIKRGFLRMMSTVVVAN
jgi:hypothetical protein